MKFLNSFIKNISFIWINRILLIVYGLISLPIIVNALGLSMSGVWFLISVFGYQLTLIEAGISTSLVRLLARVDIKKSASETSKYLLSGFLFLVFSCIVLISIIPFVENLFIKLYEVDGFEADTSTAIRIMIFSVAIGLPFKIGYSIFASNHDFYIYEIISNLTLVFKLVLLFYIYFNNNLSLADLAIITFTTQSIGYIAAYFLSLQKYKLWNHFSQIRKLRIRYLRQILSISLASLFITFASVLLMQFSLSLSGIYLKPYQLGMLGMVVLLFNSITPFFSTFATIISPFAAETYQHLRDRLELYFLELLKLMMALCFVSTTFLIFFGGDLIYFWINDSLTIEQANTVNMLLIILIIGFSFGSFSSLSRSVLVSTGNHSLAAKLDFLTAFLAPAIIFCLYSLLNLQSIYIYSITIACILIFRGIILFPLAMSNFFQTQYFKFFKDLLASMVYGLIIIITAFLIKDHTELSNNLNEYLLLLIIFIFYIVFGYKTILGARISNIIFPKKIRP